MCKTREDHGWSCACVRAQTHGDGIINYSVAFTLACNGVLMHIGTALSWVCARAPRIRLRCFSRDAVDPLTRVKLRARANFTWNIIVPVFRVQPPTYDSCNPCAFGFWSFRFPFDFVFLDRPLPAADSLVILYT